MTPETWNSIVGEMAEYFVHQDDERLQQDVLAEQFIDFLNESNAVLLDSNN